MQETWLYDILASGKLVDNRVFHAVDGIFTLSHQTQFSLYERGHNKRYKHWNSDTEIWRFLNTVNSLDLSSHKNHLHILREDYYEHNTDDPLITLSGTDTRNFRLQTGNLVGFVKQGEYSLKINSRFGDNFLKYIIADADGFLELKDHAGESSNDDFAWLLAFLWNSKFQKASRLGIPKQYQSHRERLTKPRGNLDVIDFFQNSQTGKFLSQYREHSYQNEAVSLMVAAYEALEARSPCSSLIQSSRRQYRALVEANAGMRRTRQQLLDTKHFLNPYYQEYNTVIDLSKKVLQNQSTSFGDNDDCSAFLFDVSMLFEYFIRKLLQRAGISLLPKSDGEHRIPTGTTSGYSRDLQPDILFDYNDTRYVFDVKYKYFDTRYGAAREDLFQLHTYLGQFSNDGIPVRAFGLIYPMSEARWKSFSNTGIPTLSISKIYQQGHEVDFFTLFIPIPPDDSETFVLDMKQNCEEFMKQFTDYLSASSSNP